MTRREPKRLWQITARWKSFDPVGDVMKRIISIILCVCLSALTAAGCSAADNESKPQEKPASKAGQSSAAATQPRPTTPDSAQASPDSALYDDGRVSYNELEVKKNLDEIEQAFDSIIETQGFQGAVYAKIGNDFDYIEAKGFANQGAHIDSSIYRRYYVGSLTKMFTAAAVMKLAEEKKLNLEDTLDKFFSGCVYGSEVTVRRLLSMKSGIANYLSRDAQGKTVTLVPALSGQLGEGSYEKNKATILSWILSQPLQKEKQNSFEFCDSNYYLLGEIIASVTQVPYETYMSEAVFKPADMRKTGFEPDESTARPYESQKESAPLLYDGVGWASVGLITDVSDLLKFIDALTSNQIISKKSLSLMLTDGGDGFGFGVYLNGNRVSCTGDVDAYSAKLSFTADESLIFAAVTNYSESDPDLIHRLFRNYMTKYRN